MSDTQRMLAEAAERIFRDHCTRAVQDASERGEWAAPLWDAFRGAGLHLTGRSEKRGGPGGETADRYTLIHVGGRYAVPLPLCETLLAEQVLAAAGLSPVDGPATLGPVVRGDRLRLKRVRGRWKLSGVAHRIPWARDAAALVLIAEHRGTPVTARIERPSVETPGRNTAGEPRDDVRFDEYALPDDAVGEPGRGFTVEQLQRCGALGRSTAMAGAMGRVLEMTVEYAKQRVQFGRPIGKFQAVQQQIAVMASHVAAANTAAHAAVAFGEAPFEAGAAKVRVGEAAGVVAAVAHQVHGAIGFTHEHDLHRFTRRLWAWRDEFGSEAEWALELGREAARMGGEAFWPFLTSRRRAAAVRPADLE